MRINCPLSRKNLFAAVAATALIAESIPSAHATFGISSGSDGYARHFSFQLENEHGEEIVYKLKSPKRNRFRPAAVDHAFCGQATEVLGNYLTLRQGRIYDNQASGFKFIVEYMAKKCGMNAEAFADAIGLSKEAFADISYRAYRHDLLEKRNGIIADAYQKNPSYINLHSGDKTIREINEAIADAARRHPDDSAFKAPPLTSEDLRKIRRNVAKLFVETGRKSSLISNADGSDRRWRMRKSFESWMPCWI